MSLSDRNAAEMMKVSIRPSRQYWMHKRKVQWSTWEERELTTTAIKQPQVQTHQHQHP